MGVEGRRAAAGAGERARRCSRASSARPSSACARPIICRCRSSPSSPASRNRSSARSSATRPIRRSPRSGASAKRSTCRSSGCSPRRDEEPFIEKSSRGDTPILVSDDGKMRLAIIGWIKTVEWLQWYDVRGRARRRARIGRAPARLGRMPVGDRRRVRGRGRRRRCSAPRPGETLRYRCDRPHTVRCLGDKPGRATMVCILKAAVME